VGSEDDPHRDQGHPAPRRSRRRHGAPDEGRASVLEAEGQRQAEILRAEGRKQAAILQAEGRKEAAFRDAEARERSAEAEAKATGLVSAAIAQGDLAAANFLVAEKYVEAVKAIATAPNQRVVVVPIEAAALAGTLGGIAEITRSVFGEGGAGQGGRSGLPPRVPPSSPGA